MSSESLESDLKELQEQQALILEQIDRAIALFDSSDHIINYNQSFLVLGGFSPDWLAQQPYGEKVLDTLASHGKWSNGQRQILDDIIQKADSNPTSCTIEQSSGESLHFLVTATSNGGYLLNIRRLNVTLDSQDIVNRELRRLTFLLGLTERLQPATDIEEIGQFALSYLIETTNAAFGDVKVITGEGENRQAGLLVNEITSEFIATYGDAIPEMEAQMKEGIPYGEGLLWQVVETGKPFFVQDYANHPQAVNAFRNPGIGQLGIFPIPAHSGDIIGVLTLESRSENPLQSQLQEDMVLAACRTLGVAIERAQVQQNLRQANEDLAQASQMKSEFLASMSHELRTPLNSILGFADLLERQRKEPLSDNQLKQVKAIKRSGEHLLQLINDILDLSKIEAGKTELELQPVVIHSLCSQCLRMVQPRADKKRIALSLELDYQIERAQLDERRVRQILINLLSNAIKFTPEEGKVKLSGNLRYGRQLLQEARPDRSPVNDSTPYLCLEVSDTGIGIPKEKQGLLFRPFQQVDSSLTRRHEGTGLGLALTKRLAELHGGTVSVESEENEGSIFRVWLPLTELRTKKQDSLSEGATGEETPEVMNRQLGQDQPETTNSPRVLVVEDQPFNQALICQVLELEGYAVEVIYDGRTMQELIAAELRSRGLLPHLILLDIQLPEVDGFELLKQLRNTPYWQDVPVIAITAMAMPGDRDRCLNAGADDYIAKPLHLETVIEKVQQLITEG
ncbi:histidine kinase [Halothece sp. PCC 7418]|uniref:hybrid sensor histidine kinase/response regulator n=1 Tax=Halothece sp. (strain PCC 7418) TaxID=65093 RepID=UPI0002A073AB|nr:ATP-binding protein [Halothece sp. PCC 7418]AFZ43120.1 histidine kinase [Halothece sp. PCC 7418]